MLSPKHHVFETRPPDLIVAQEIIRRHVLVLLQLVCKSVLSFTLPNRHSLREKIALALNGFCSFESTFVVSLNRLLRIHSFHGYAPN